MQQLYTVGYPVPQVLLLDTEGAYLGKPLMIMERIIGSTLGAIVDRTPREARREPLERFCRMFVDLHALDWRPFAEDPALYEMQEPSAAFAQQLSGWHAFAHARQITAFDPVFDWLKAQLRDVRFGPPSLLRGSHRTRVRALARANRNRDPRGRATALDSAVKGDPWGKIRTQIQRRYKLPEATWGKRKAGIRVASLAGARLTLMRALVRSALKFLPWQIAHTSIYQIGGWPFAPKEPSPIVIAGFVLVYVLVGSYLLSAWLSKRHRTPYDWAAGSVVIVAT
jgi:hypothetical protein